MKIDKSQIVSAVEFGTSKISVLIGTRCKEGKIKVLGFAQKESDGCICKGEIIDMPKAVRIFHDVLDKAEDLADIEWNSTKVYASISGNHITSVPGHGSIVIEESTRKVDQAHINKVYQLASIPTTLDQDRVKINSVAGHLLLDGRICKTPLEQIGSRLEAKTHIVTGSRARVENSLAPLKDAHIEHPKPVFAGLASAMIAIKDNEQEKGVLFMDIGAGTTDYLLLCEQGIYSSGVVAAGIDHIINDIAIAYQLTFKEGKIVYDAITQNTVESSGFVEVKNEAGGKILNTRKIQMDVLSTIINLRLNEIFEIVKKKSKMQAKSQGLVSLVVISGGGALLGATEECAKSFFKIPVRMHTKNELKNYSYYDEDLLLPQNTMIAGLLEHGLKHSTKSSIIQNIDRNVTMILSKAYKKFKTAIKM